MKKTKNLFFAGLAIMALAAGGFAYPTTKPDKSNHGVTLDEIEATTACEVSSDASKNQGYCSSLYNAPTDACTETGDGGAVRCSGNI
ncbi:MAG: hypothetical protein K2F94_05360 [Muribaculaceae bacterium]|nr:hypothetical protein [Muribaculaceae bacterium]MDE6400460.1 hypothetical protein [Muribaculaceae bacterium]MDE6533095.1 hypothetical protein [Muribaculaceae bacterium]